MGRLADRLPGCRCPDAAAAHRRGAVRAVWAPAAARWPPDVRAVRRRSTPARRGAAGAPQGGRALRHVRRGRAGRSDALRVLPTKLPPRLQVGACSGLRDSRARRCSASGTAPARGCKAGDWLCRLCVARPGRLPDHANQPRAPDHYRAAGLCRYGGERDRADRRACRRCRRLQADATAPWQAAHPPDPPRLYADARARRRQRIAAGLCAECSGERDRPDGKLCRRSRRIAAVKSRTHRRSEYHGRPYTA